VYWGESLNKLLENWQPMNIVGGSAIILSGPRNSGRTFVAHSLNQFLRKKMTKMDQQLLNVIEVHAFGNNERNFSDFCNHVKENSELNHVTILPNYNKTLAARNKLKEAL